MIKIQDLFLAVLCIELSFGLMGALIQYVNSENVLYSNFTYNILNTSNLSDDLTLSANNSITLMHKVQSDEFTLFNIFNLFSDFLRNIISILFFFGFFLVNTFSLHSIIGTEASFFLALMITTLFDVIIIFNIFLFILNRYQI